MAILRASKRSRTSPGLRLALDVSGCISGFALQPAGTLEERMEHVNNWLDATACKLSLRAISFLDSTSERAH